MTELVHLDVADGVATVTLDSEHNRNALSRQLVTELRDHLATAEADAFLAEVRPRRDEQPELVTLAEFVVAARRGDPAEAERLWPAIEADEGIELFERVRASVEG